MSDTKKRYYRKYVELYPLLEKLKLWPSRTGQLHGVKTVQRRGGYIEVTTHCGKSFITRDSRKSRAARWLRNKWAVSPCKACRVPQWKLEKYTKTFFSQHHGKDLKVRPQPAGPGAAAKEGGAANDQADRAVGKDD